MGIILINIKSLSIKYQRIKLQYHKRLYVVEREKTLFKLSAINIDRKTKREKIIITEEI